MGIKLVGPKHPPDAVDVGSWQTLRFELSGACAHSASTSGVVAPTGRVPQIRHSAIALSEMKRPVGRLRLIGILDIAFNFDGLTFETQTT